MWRKCISFIALLAIAGTLNSAAAKSKKAKKAQWETRHGLYTTIETSKGKIVCQLFENEAPKTVDNFVGLAKGTKEWTNPKSGKKVKKKFYNGLIFHRVIPKFMIQAGCPLGNGRGGPGYRFEDEISDRLKFTRPGLLAMANAGPNTNGSQFFITEAPTPWLNGRHTIFGQVVEGQDVVNTIANVDRGPGDKPNVKVKIKKVTFRRVGKEPTKKAKGAKSMALKGKKILFVVAPRNFRDEEYFDPKKILTDAGATVITASLTKGELIGMLGGKIGADILLTDVKPQDYDAAVFVGGNGASVYFNNPLAHNIANEISKQGKVLGAICVAPATLANAGLLKDRKATAFQSVKQDLSKGGANYTGAPVEVDGKIITASGPQASKEFGLRILKALTD